MNFRGWIVLTIVATSLVLGLSPIRIFPFSNFPLFAYILPEPTIMTLMMVDEFGNRKILSQDAIRPLTRIHLHQTLTRFRHNGIDLGPALQWIQDTVKATNPGARSLEVVLITLNTKIGDRRPYIIEKTETLDVIPIH